ncbi:MAG: polysaccharide biosynthesis/export family protein, partial [Alphaproteobacteria bacterium]|nr:polysaccharide biosynthesis/export family protein [Alphaproteobacteria bacterium]
MIGVIFKRLGLLLLLSWAGFFIAICGANAELSKLEVGDVLGVVLPGEASFEKPFQINREGAIYLPEVGDVKISGLTLPEARAEIQTQLEAVYKDLSRLQVSIIERRLPVMVLGYIKTPGPVDLPRGATVQMAINEA